MAMPLSELKPLFDTYLFSNYNRAALPLVRGEGAYVWDDQGRRFLDMIMGLAVNGLGHCPPRVVEAIRAQAGRLIHFHNNFLWENQALAARALSERTTDMGTAKVFFCNSGTEASEGALKLARLFGHPKGKYKFIALENGFHGRTFGALSATGQSKFHKGLEPLLPGFCFIPINDIHALETAFDGQTAGFLAEPVQGEGGFFPCGQAFLRRARELCDQHRALLMYDEIQCGIGRTGSFFAYQALGAPAPDILWLAKTLGGGFPVGAILARPGVAAVMVPGTHASTFGGNPLACAAILGMIETFDAEKILENVRTLGSYLRAGLEKIALRFPKQIKEVRGIGLMQALDLTNPGAPLVERCRELGLLINCTHDTVLRFIPPLNVKPGELDEALAIVERAMEKN